MLHKSQDKESWKGKSWKEILRTSYKDGDDLKDWLDLSESEVEDINKIASKYPICTNDYYLSLINKEDLADPIRKLSIPSHWEMSDGGEEDTSGEASNTVIPGMQHKYAQTALILSTSECAMYCRHCFRKRMVGLTDDEIASHLDDMVDYIKNHPEISNILISGGDAFLNSNERIREYLDKFSSLEQLDFIRFGTRTPVVLPQRITTDQELCDILREYNAKKQIYIVTHFDHPNEVTEEATEAIKILLEMGIVIKNQVVLLRGINDKPEVLADLLKKISSIGVIPYYIFQCRPVRGVLNNFQIPLFEGAKIVEKAMALQNGQGKCARYVMSHPTGKIEIVGSLDGKNMIFKYNQAKYKEDYGRVFIQELSDDQGWLEEIKR